MSLIYHITNREAADSARKSGEYRAESLASQGFIHFSQRGQVAGVAQAFYAGQKDLVILVVETERLKAPLKYEAPAHPAVSAGAALPAAEQLFPHLYGPLNFEAVTGILDLPLKTGGGFDFPNL